MTAAALRVITTDASPSAVDVFIARAEARALLWKVGALELTEAVDILQYAAVPTGVVTELGQDEVQSIMAHAFHEVCR
jgi:hypothetical protein